MVVETIDPQVMLGMDKKVIMLGKRVDRKGDGTTEKREIRYFFYTWYGSSQNDIA